VEQDTFDPFTQLLIALPDATPARRAEIFADLRGHEAEELAWGRRHVTVVHDYAGDAYEQHNLDTYCAVATDLLAAAEWYRLSGTNGQTTITIGGPDADHWADTITNLATRMNLGRWQIHHGAFVAV
jgi:hypothetical protein